MISPLSSIISERFSPPSGWSWFPVMGPDGPWGWSCLRPPDLKGGQDESDPEAGNIVPEMYIYRGTQREPGKEPKTVAECNVEEHCWTSWTTESVPIAKGCTPRYYMVRKCLRCSRVETA